MPSHTRDMSQTGHPPDTGAGKKPELVTERLILRPFAAEDVPEHIDLMGDPEVAATLTQDGKVEAEAARWRNAASYIGHWAIRGFGFFSVFERDSESWVGRVGPIYPHGWPGIECGWAIRQACWGRGYATEAAICAIDWIFAQKPDLQRIISVIDPSNLKSEIVARKIGEAPTDEVFEFGDLSLRIWAASREEWLQRHGTGGGDR